MKRKHSSKFRGSAIDYDESRPGYPAALLSQIAVDAGVEDSLIIDVGAGTGTLTRGLVALGYRCIGVEPSEDMRELAHGAAVIDGSSENLPFPDGAASLLIAGQAMHYFRPLETISEFVRVAPGGRFAGVSNRLVGSGRSLFEEVWNVLGGREALPHDESEPLQAFNALLTRVRSVEEEHDTTYDLFRCLALLRSMSRFQRASPDQQRLATEILTEQLGSSSITLHFRCRAQIWQLRYI